jgi:hypothetical protein
MKEINSKKYTGKTEESIFQYRINFKKKQDAIQVIYKYLLANFLDNGFILKDSKGKIGAISDKRFYIFIKQGNGLSVQLQVKAKKNLQEDYFINSSLEGSWKDIFQDAVDALNMI